VLEGSSADRLGGRLRRDHVHGVPNGSASTSELLPGELRTRQRDAAAPTAQPQASIPDGRGRDRSRTTDAGRTGWEWRAGGRGSEETYCGQPVRVCSWIWRTRSQWWGQGRGA